MNQYGCSKRFRVKIGVEYITHSFFQVELDLLQAGEFPGEMQYHILST